MHLKPTLLAALALLSTGGALLLTGCQSGPRVAYGDAQAVETITTDFGSTDLQQIAEKMVDSLLVFPPIVEETAKRRPVVLVDRVKNKTMQHIDTESLTDTIRTRLLRSGKFRFTDRTTDPQLTEEIRIQQESGLVNPATAARFGKQIGAEYMLTANLSEITKRAGRTTDVYYKFTMNLRNLETGMLEWADEKEIRKQAVRSRFGL